MKKNTDFLLNPIFIFSILLLALNDHFFKFQFGNWFTGKFSDILGIITLPLLLNFMFPKLKLKALVITVLFFTFWKSPYSEFLIHFYNSISPISITRVPDYSDLWAFLFLPIPYFLITRRELLHQIRLKKISVFPVLVVSVFVLMSTSPGNYYYRYHEETGNLVFNNLNVTVKTNKNDLFKRLKDRNIHVYKDTAYIINQNQWRMMSGIKIQTRQIIKEKELFKLNQDSLKSVILKEIDQANDYKIDSLQVNGDKMTDIRFSTTGNDTETTVYLHSLNVGKFTKNEKMKGKIKRVYKAMLKKEILGW